MVNNYPDTFALVEYHMGQSTWGDQRSEFYYPDGGLITPAAWFDGTDDAVGQVGSISQQYLLYRDDYYQPRLGTYTDVTLKLSAEQVGSTGHEVTATICLEPDGKTKSVRLYMVQVLDHWPAAQTYPYVRNGFKQAASTETLWLYPGECYEVTRTFWLDSDSVDAIDDVKIIAWSQETVSNANKDAHVHQAAIMGWPFYAYSDFNRDGEVNDADYAIFEECLAGPDEGTSACGAEEFIGADLDNDGDVDLRDFAEFQRALE